MKSVFSIRSKLRISLVDQKTYVMAQEDTNKSENGNFVQKEQ